MNKKAIKQRRAKAAVLKIIVSFVALMFMALVGLLWFLRPTESVSEKRLLTTFPKFTLASFWDGTFFNDDTNSTGVSIWYSDTYPLREALISGYQSLQSHYGIRSDQIVGTAKSADAIPETADRTALEEEASASTEEAEPSPSPSEEPEEEEQTVDATVYEEGEMNDGVYITQNTAFQLYYFSQDAADEFMSNMNQIYDNIGNDVNMYVMICPTSTTLMLDTALREKIGVSNEQDAINYLYSGLNENIHAVNVYDNLKKHNAEYIYYHTDHHWTGRGAYYAYQVFCESKGITAHDIDDYDTYEAEDFEGSWVAYTGNSPELLANLDTWTGYIPKGTNDMHMLIDEDSTELVDYNIVTDVVSAGYGSSSYYMGYVSGDRPFSYAHNKTITDGSAVLVIKDSYGDAFIPWLIDHYEYIYWIDYRYTDDTILGLVDAYGIQDVIYEIEIHNASSDYAQSRYLTLGAARNENSAGTGSGLAASVKAAEGESSSSSNSSSSTSEATENDTDNDTEEDDEDETTG